MTRTRLLSVLLLVAVCVAVLMVVRWVDVRTLDAVDPSADTLLLGASITFRWPERSPESYARLFGSHAQNLTVPGFQTRHLRANLPIETDARRIWLDLGGPDLKHDRTPIQTATDLVAIVEVLVETTDAYIYVAATLPHRDGEALVEETNGWTQALLRGYRPDRVTFIPLELESRYFLADGKHPSPEGYAVLEGQVAPYLADPKVACWGCG